MLGLVFEEVDMIFLYILSVCQPDINVIIDNLQSYYFQRKRV